MLRFTGAICSFGTTSGARVVVGHWPGSPFGAFADVMVERPDGHRLLLAPTSEVGDFVGRIYAFDEVVRTPVSVVRSSSSLIVDADPLRAHVEIGGRTGLGRVLRIVPGRLATSVAWTTLVDPFARLLRPGVRTRGRSAGGREHYGATDEHAVTAVRATWGGEDLGALAPIDPPVRFGFGSSPRTPSIVDLVTTVRA